MSENLKDKAILTCALTGVLTNPKQHPVPVTPAEMAAAAREAYDAGASIMHVHLRQQIEGMGHLPRGTPKWPLRLMWPFAKPARVSSST